MGNLAGPLLSSYIESKIKKGEEGEEVPSSFFFSLDTSSVKALKSAQEQISSMPGCDVRPVRKSSTGNKGNGSVFSSHPVGSPSWP